MPNTSLPRRATTRRFSAITTRYGGNGVYDAVERNVATAIVSREHAEEIAAALESAPRTAGLYAWRTAYPTEVVRRSRRPVDRMTWLKILARRTRTVRYSTFKVSFLESLARPTWFASGTPVEVDGDALAMLRAVSS